MERILVIDDSEGLATALELLLGREGFEVITAQDGKTGLGLLTEQPFDLLVTDLCLPDIPGREVIARTRELHPACRIIAMTAEGPSPAPGTVRVSQADAFLEKPFGIDALLSSIRILLSRQPPA